MAQELPDLDVMKVYYSTDSDPAKIRKEIGKDVNQDHYRNTCIIRISKSFNYANHPIPRDSEKFRTKQGGDGKWYGLRVSEFRKYMGLTYGKPYLTVERAKGKPIVDSMFRGYRGIICLAVDGWSDATGHVSIWWEDRMLYGNPDYFGRAHEVLLWTEGTRFTQASL